MSCYRISEEHSLNSKIRPYEPRHAEAEGNSTPSLKNVEQVRSNVAYGMATDVVSGKMFDILYNKLVKQVNFVERFSKLVLIASVLLVEKVKNLFESPLLLMYSNLSPIALCLLLLAQSDCYPHLTSPL